MVFKYKQYKILQTNFEQKYNVEKNWVVTYHTGSCPQYPRALKVDPKKRMQILFSNSRVSSRMTRYEM